MIVAPPRASGQSSGGVSGDWKGAGSWGAWGGEWVKHERGGQIQAHFPPVPGSSHLLFQRYLPAQCSVEGEPQGWDLNP